MPQAARALTTEAPAGRPFLKWVGGKRQLLARIHRHLPKELSGTYHEPFVGGGALFFNLRPEKAVLSDANERLIRTYRGVRDDVERVVALLRGYPHDKKFFLEARQWPIDGGTDAEVAAWMIYLNKTGFNGLYRVNRSNVFNVPFGRYVRPTICDEHNLRACSAALAGVDLRHEGFEAVHERARPGDLVYFDPPYVPLSKTSSFTSYTAAGFGPDQQVRLRDLALALKQRGVQVVLSNSDSKEVRALYRDGFRIVRVPATRAVNARASARGKKVGEVVIV